MKVLFVLIFFLYISLYLYFKELIYINFENLKLEEFVAILSLLAYTYLSQKVSEFIVQIETLDSLYLSFMKGR